MREAIHVRYALRIVAVFASALLIGGCDSADIEQRMLALCKIDGGTRVYESVTLPSTYFDKFGGVRTHDSMASGNPDGSWFSRIGDDEYRVIWTRTYIVGKKLLGYESEESLVRSHTGIYKWPEERLLGDEVIYDHGYGTKFSFGFQPGGTYCPTKRENLLAAVFRQR